jgi:hypothetical protein
MPTIPCHPVIRSKTGSNGKVMCRKGRLVAGGHRQIKGVNFNEMFSLAAKMTSNHVVLAYKAQNDWEVHQVDVIGAYLNAGLDKGIYMLLPAGILKKGQEGKVCQLLKGLYGLKQAGRVWYKRLYTTFINDLHFTWSGVDHSVFFRHQTTTTQLSQYPWMTWLLLQILMKLLPCSNPNLGLTSNSQTWTKSAGYWVLKSNVIELHIQSPSTKRHTLNL